MEENTDVAQKHCCHEDWHEYLRKFISYDTWSSHEALLLIAGIFPNGAEISESDIQSRRYGAVEAPAIISARLLDQEGNAHYSDSYEKALILAGQRLRDVREQWCRGTHTTDSNPPAYFVHWAISKNIPLCWLNVWRQFATVESAPSYPAGVVADDRSQAWWIENPNDARPDGFQDWYVPARHFARNLVKENPTLLKKRDLLAQKVSSSLANAGIYKRGREKPLNYATIKKAFANIILS